MMSRKETLAMVEACKKKGITVTGVLIAASCIVMVDLRTAGKPLQDLILPVELPVNLRPFVPGAPEINNCLLFSVPLILYIRISKDICGKFWNIANFCTCELQQAMKEERLLKTFLDIREKLNNDPMVLRTGDEQGIRITPFLIKKYPTLPVHHRQARNSNQRRDYRLALATTWMMQSIT